MGRRGTRRRLTSAVAGLGVVLSTSVLVVSPSLAATGDVTTVAGGGGSLGDGGPATAAMLNHPANVVGNSTGTFYIADTDNNRVRKVDPTGRITTYAGTGTSGFSGDGGPATAASLNRPGGLALDTAGNLFLSDTGNSRVRKVAPNGVITTVAGNGTPALPGGLVVDTAGNLFVTHVNDNRVRKVAPNGVITIVAGNGTAGFSGDGGPATAASLNTPHGLALDTAGNLFVADKGNHRLRRIAPNGVITTVAGNGTASFSGDGGLATAAGLRQPTGLIFDQAGNLFVADTANNRVRKVNPAGVITTVAGDGTASFSGDGGLATAAAFRAPTDVALAPGGDLLIADKDNHRVRRVEGITGAPLPPAPPSITSTSPPSPASSNAPLLLGTAPAGTDVSIHTDSSCASAVLATGTAATFASTGIPVAVGNDTTTTFWATATNANGTSACSSSSVTYTEDSSAPAPPVITQMAPVVAADTTPTWEFSGEAGSSFQCDLTRSGLTVVAPGPCTSPAAFDLSAQPDGVYTFSVRALDAAGNSSQAATGTYTLDRTAPAPPTFTAAPSDGTDASPTWSFTAEVNAMFRCRVSRGATVVADAFCTSPVTYDLSGEPDGTYTLEVRAIDAAGNASAWASDSYSLDRVATSQPTFTAEPPATSADPVPSWSFESEPGATFECELARGGIVVVANTACSSPAAYDLTGQPDATYTLAVRSIDPFGNPSGAVTDDYSLDRVAPATPTFTAEPLAAGADPSPSWSFSGDGDATFDCDLTRDGIVVAVTAACASPITYDLSSEPDGTYTLSVRATDGAGNTSAPVTGTYTLDTDAPSVPIVTATPGTTGSDTSPSWSFSGDAGATFQCELTRGGVVVAAGTCASPVAYDLSSQPDGTYTLTVRAVDGAGNASGAVTDDYTLDTTAPAVPTFTATPGASGSDPMPSWSFSGDVDATFECELTRGGVVVEGGPCASLAAYDLSSEPDGTYTLTVRAVDESGNRSAAATDDYTLDRVVPDVPSFATAPPTTGSDPTPSWSFSGEAGARFECELRRGGVVVTAGTCASPADYDLSSEPDGTYTLAVRAVDEAGNTSGAVTDDYTLDRVSPAAATFTAEPPAIGSDPSPSWSFSGDAGATFECELRRGGVVVTAGSCASPAGYDLSSRPDGTYTLTVRAVDDAGNASAPLTGTYTLDTAAPAAAIFTASPPATGSDPSPSWSFSGEAGARFECELRRGGVVVSTGSCASPSDYDLSSEPDGTYTLTVRAVDDAGNTSAAATDDYTLDRVAPAVPTFTARPGTTGPDPSPAWSFSGDAGATFQCELTRGGVVVVAGSCASPAGYDLSTQPDGTYTLTVRAVDEAGNTSAAATDDYTLDRAVTPSEPSVPIDAPPPPPASEPPPDPTPSSPSSPTTSVPTTVESVEATPEPVESPGPAGATPPSPAPATDEEAEDRSAVEAGPDGPREALLVERASADGDDGGLLPVVMVRTLEKAVFPVLLLLVMAAFLGVQNRIDRADPKLSAAPIRSEPLTFN